MYGTMRASVRCQCACLCAHVLTCSHLARLCAHMFPRSHLRADLDHGFENLPSVAVKFGARQHFRERATRRVAA